MAAALERLGKEGIFTGAVVVRNADGVRFSAAHGLADPVSGAAFTATTPVDSASLAKPMTAAAVLSLVVEGRVRLDAPVRDYVAEYPHADTRVRDLLAHSAGLPDYEPLQPVAGRTNADLLSRIGELEPAPRFAPGSAFSYCNICYDTLALIAERVTGRSYVEVLREHAGLPDGIRPRPVALADWSGRAVGHRRMADGRSEPADSGENEAFYGGSNVSVSAAALAEWGAAWWSSLAHLRPLAAAPVDLPGGRSGLTLGNWYCAADRRRCHYVGHHRGFHHMLYWDAEARISVAMVTNNTLAPEWQQRLQRALVAFAADKGEAAEAELASPIRGAAAAPGTYRTPAGEIVVLEPGEGPVLQLSRAGVTYAVYPVGEGIGYAPGLDIYVSGASGGGLHLLSLYEDSRAEPEVR